MSTQEEEKASPNNLDRIQDEDIMLSDELLSGEDHPLDLELPGNAQYLETPRILQVIDFRLIDFNSTFQNKKEVLKMKSKKILSIDC